MDGPFSGTNLDRNAAIYRIHAQQHLKELLSGNLILRASTCWPDAYENLISRCAYDYIGDDGKIKQVFLGGNRFPVFGQCWSMITESDALWRIYSHVKPNRGLNSFFCRDEGVRLRTTAKKLVNSLAKGMGTQNAKKCYIGRVTYFEEDHLRQYVGNAVRTYREMAFSGIDGHADGLLLKRSPFAHESEVRLLYIDSDREFEGQQQIEVPIDVNDVIEEITLDPRVHGGGQEARRAKWLKKNGFKNQINRSLLYLGVLMTVPLFNPEDLKKKQTPV